jgi:signal transduction histidine kinase
VACEALTNVVKHSGASGASIDTRRDDGTLVIEVADDGSGGAQQTGGSGLRGLADRVEARGGRLLVQSVPGAGTRIRGEIPCVS